MLYLKCFVQTWVPKLVILLPKYFGVVLLVNITEKKRFQQTKIELFTGYIILFPQMQTDDIELLSLPQAGGALTFAIAAKVSKKARLKKGDCAHRHFLYFWKCYVCAPCIPNLSHGSVWHLCFVYTGKHSGFAFCLVLGIRFVNTITGFWAGFVVRRRVVKNWNIFMTQLYKR